ncbi:MAG: GTP-binding protein [Gammaproteobacteria bacterium]|nr:GTP-binding protein [Gammaproteobacteria bacterium]NIR83756.1 GTP-binding protein [Gammaproteobacteria bacterium]NIU05062.1 GTP-binding protein [Gammaproteobacteria bacterium]NIX86335.1 GTP-binding protein [Gammaproteobacteria bacterium]
MSAKTPLTLIAGPLGAGKTTLLRGILAGATERLAVIVNEFGDLGVDSRVVRGEHVDLTEIDGGCVCCELAGAFEEAVREILVETAPERIVVETTGVAEPEALALDIPESLPETRVDGVIVVLDGDTMVRYAELGAATRMQIGPADLLILNKADRIPPERVDELKGRLGAINGRAPIIVTKRGRVGTQVLFGVAHDPTPPASGHVHEPTHARVVYETDRAMRREPFERTAEALDPKAVYRAKGFVKLIDGDYLFNYVGGRWELEPFETDRTQLEFIGPRVTAVEHELVQALEACGS